jgi:hypothetical protein
MALSPQYSWPEPDNSSLVKNGAQDIRALGDAIDTSVWNVGYGQAGKNKFINGNMAIAQRGATAVTAATRTFAVDRNFGQLSGSGAFTVEQVIDAPSAANAGQYSMKVVVTTANGSIAAGNQYFLGQYVEGLNFASFQFGTASAQTVTISFWVKSSITGTFGVCIRNSAANRSYVSTYTVSAANTWEKKTVTIAGDTSGTWLQDTGIGARIEWTLAAGTDVQTATPNAWTASNDQTTASQTNWMATLSNSFQITAVQIEAGSKATPFQIASGSVGSELLLCQRYYFRSTPTTSYGWLGSGIASSTTSTTIAVTLPATMRAVPGQVDFSTLAVIDSVTSTAVTTCVIDSLVSSNNFGVVSAGVASGLTQYRPYYARQNASSAGYIGFSAEL